ncbi:MAG TPA: hypothetical protein VKB29_12680, partial [Candidatus Binataceae bacterium]|nr:hypothetical protein [Candidatus Binataceae bacterium]
MILHRCTGGIRPHTRLRAAFTPAVSSLVGKPEHRTAWTAPFARNANCARFMAQSLAWLLGFVLLSELIDLLLLSLNLLLLRRNLSRGLPLL